MILPLTGCGSEQAGDGSSTKRPGAGSGSSGITVSPIPVTRLEISVKASKTATTDTWTLTCDPAGGDHPQADKACAALAKAKSDWYAPVAKDAICTQIYGGPQQATVKGTWQGKPVDTTFKRSNGCELNRWKAVEAMFGGGR